MTRKYVAAAALLAALALFSSAAIAEDLPKSEAPKAPATVPHLSADSTTDGVLEVGGRRIAYQAIAGTIIVGATSEQDAALGLDGHPLDAESKEARDAKDPDKASPTARMFYVAYIKKDEKSENRPITFLYNGGPGSSTVWLHMGAFGPRRVITLDDQHTPAAPYRVVDNAFSLLDASDLVFIDMPGTGFGRLAGKEKEKAFWGVDEDAHAFSRFINRFLSKNGRWNSPKFLFGESYGTTRSAVLANILEQENHIDLNGVILLSQILNFANSADSPRWSPGDDLPYVLSLPTMAASANYHHKLPHPVSALEPFLKEVEAFALSDYSSALAQGTELSPAAKEATAEKLHEYTGLPVAYLIKANLRVSAGAFEKNLQDDQGLTTGRLDTRFSGPSINPLSEEAEYDPQSASIASAYVAALNDYVRRQLKYGADETYNVSADFGQNVWDTRHQAPGGPSPQNSIGLNVMPDLATAMILNPRLKVFLTGGYYDLATPFFAAVYEAHHLPISDSLRGNIQSSFYDSGHMVYAHEPALKRIHDDVAGFIRGASAEQK